MPAGFTSRPGWSAPAERGLSSLPHRHQDEQRHENNEADNRHREGAASRSRRGPCPRGLGRWRTLVRSPPAAAAKFKPHFDILPSMSSVSRDRIRRKQLARSNIEPSPRPWPVTAQARSTNGGDMSANEPAIAILPGAAESTLSMLLENECVSFPFLVAVVEPNLSMWHARGELLQAGRRDHPSCAAGFRAGRSRNCRVRRCRSASNLSQPSISRQCSKIHTLALARAAWTRACLRGAS